MKLTKMKYKTMKDETKVFSYLIHISKKVVKESGIDDTKEMQVIAKNKEIIIKEK